jgi:TRAP transporter TAXI family solute receptor
VRRRRNRNVTATKGTRLMRLSSAKLIVLAITWLAALTVLLAFFLRAGDHHVVIAAGPRAGDSFELAASIARVVEDRYPRMDIAVFETHGSSENVRLLESGLADFATMQADVESDGSVHAVASLYFDAYQLIVAADSDIQGPADLAGHKIAIGPRGSGHYESFWFLIEHYGISPDQLTALPMSARAANFAMRHGQVDAIFRVHAVGNGSIRQLSDEVAVRLIPINQANALAIKHPAVTSGSISQGSYRGNPPLPEQDQPTAMVERFLVARGNLEESVVTEFTRTLFEDRSKLIAQNPLAGFIAAPNTEGRLALPIHKGARRYYDREKPSFWQQNTRIIAPTLYVIVILSSAFFAIRARVQGSRRVRMSHFNLELMDIATEATNLVKREDLLPLRDRLVTMLRGVVVDLDHERVSQAEFEHFSFTWNAVDTLVRDRLLTSNEFGSDYRSDGARDD